MLKYHIEIMRKLLLVVSRELGMIISFGGPLGVPQWPLAKRSGREQCKISLELPNRKHSLVQNAFWTPNVFLPSPNISYEKISISS